MLLKVYILHRCNSHGQVDGSYPCHIDRQVSRTFVVRNVFKVETGELTLSLLSVQRGAAFDLDLQVFCVAVITSLMATTP